LSGEAVRGRSHGNQVQETIETKDGEHNSKQYTGYGRNGFHKLFSFSQ
jgi:hypothetical protein